MNILLIGASGYVGSRIAHDFSKQGHKITGCDIQPSSTPEYFSSFHQQRYRDLPDSVFDGIDAVLWFAGHANVRIAQAEPWETFENNVGDLLAFSRRVKEHGLYMIYASSASVLSSAQENYMPVADEFCSNPYDASKLAFDILAKSLDMPVFGLRMATVSGWSPNMRWDTLFNAMNRSAYQDLQVSASNCSNYRSVLFMDDLMQYLGYQLKTLSSTGKLESPVQVPLGSWSGSIGTMAAEIAGHWDVPVNFGAGTNTYSFVISDRSLQEAIPSAADFYQSIPDRCRHFATQMGWAETGAERKIA